MTTLAAPEPGARVRWEIHHEGKIWRETDIRGEHLAFIALMNGEDSWKMLDLETTDPTVGPVRMMLMLTALLAVDRGVHEPDELAKVMVEVRRLTAEQLLASLVVLG